MADAVTIRPWTPDEIVIGLEVRLKQAPANRYAIVGVVGEEYAEAATKAYPTADRYPCILIGHQQRVSPHKLRMSYEYLNKVDGTWRPCGAPEPAREQP